MRDGASIAPPSFFSGGFTPAVSRKPRQKGGASSAMLVRAESVCTRQVDIDCSSKCRFSAGPRPHDLGRIGQTLGGTHSSA
jgi:hypothetical protein